MFMDSTLEFADATALDLVGTGQALVGNVVDTAVARDIGNGQTLYLIIQVDTAVNSALNTATVSFELSSDAQAAIAVNGTETIHVKTYDIPQATLVAGYQMVIPLPAENPAYERYIGIVQNVGTEKVTAGKINAFLTLDPAGNKAYPDATN